MNEVKNTFRFCWAIYGLIIFILCVIIYLPLFLFSFYFLPAGQLKKFIDISYYLVPRCIFYPCGIRIRTIGESNINPDENYIIVSNHQSILDIFANPGASPLVFKYLSKMEVHKMPVLHIIADQYCVYVDRKNPESRKKSFQDLIDYVNKGHSILVYPEGTRNRTSDPLKKFYDGAFRLAILTQKPIMVQTLVNSGNLSSPIRSFDLFPGEIKCYISKPVSTIGLTLDDIPLLKEKVRNIMLNRLIPDHPSYELAI